jgi:prevent-host-death family protein
MLRSVFTLTTVAARRQFAHLVNRVWFTKERAVLTRYGKAVAAIVPVEDLEKLERSGKAKTPGKASRKPKASSRTGRARR